MLPQTPAGFKLGSSEGGARTRTHDQFALIEALLPAGVEVGRHIHPAQADVF